MDTDSNKIDKYGRYAVIPTEAVTMLLEGHSITGAYIRECDEAILFNGKCEIMGIEPMRIYEDLQVTPSEFHEENCKTWLIPWKYTILDIKDHVLGLCSTDAEVKRINDEFELFEEHDMLRMLQYIKYLVDLMKERSVVWGVGRGSSVSIYTLYLMELHMVDSIKYELDFMEFFK